MPREFQDLCTGCLYSNLAQLSHEDRIIRSAPLSMEDNAADVLLIFQAPGVVEWRCGRPISNVRSGSAGGRLMASMNRVGKTRSDFNITNTVQCFPGRNKDTNRDHPPPEAVRRHCAKWLKQDIDSAPYKKIVVFGSIAAKTVRELGFDEKTDSRFEFIRHPTGGLTNIALDRALSDIGT